MSYTSTHITKTSVFIVISVRLLNSSQVSHSFAINLSFLSLKEMLLTGNSSESEVEACPELYKGLEYDPPYYSHAFEAECDNKIPLKKLVTFLVDASQHTHADLESLLEAILSRWAASEPQKGNQQQI